MRALIVAALAAGFAASAGADLVVGNGRNELRLLNEPCTDQAILSAIKEEYRDKFKRVHAKVGKDSHFGCWIDTREGYYFIQWASGEGVAYPVEAFTEQPGV